MATAYRLPAERVGRRCDYPTCTRAALYTLLRGGRAVGPPYLLVCEFHTQSMPGYSLATLARPQRKASGYECICADVSPDSHPEELLWGHLHFEAPPPNPCPVHRPEA